MAALLFFLAFAVLGPSLTWAQEPARPDTTQPVPVVSSPTDSSIAMSVTLPEVTVEGLLNGSSSRPAAHVTTLDSAAVARSGAQSVADLLAARTNLFVKRYGSGGLATASMRGMGGNQTLVLVDGQRVTDPQTGQMDLSLLPSLLIESAQVVHGSQAGRYGSGTLGGVVRLRTRRPSGALRTEAKIGTGAFGWETASGVVSGVGDRWSGLLAAEGMRSTGDFPYTNESLVPARTQRRANAQRRMGTVFGRLARQGASSRTSVTMWGTGSKRGLPGTANASSSNATQWDRQGRLSLTHHHTARWGQLRLTARGQRSTLRFRNPAANSGRSRADTSRTWRTTLEAQATFTPRPDLLVTTGATAGYDRATLRSGVHRWRLGTYADVTWSLGPLTLHPALRLDLDRPAGVGQSVTALSPQLGAVWQPGPDWLRVHGQVGRAFRAPNFNERFSEPGGNPTLRAEKGWNAETGVEVQLGTEHRAVQSEVTAFVTRLTNKIVWQPSFVGPGLQVWRPQNRAEVLSRGVEWTTTGRWRMTRDTRLNGRLTFAHVAATDQGVPQARAYGKQLPYTPRERLKSQLGLAWRWLRLDLSAQVVGPRYVTADESQSLPPYQVIDTQLQAQRPIGPVTVMAQLGIQNLFDTDYNIVRLYPMPPRHVRARLTISFTP